MFLWWDIQWFLSFLSCKQSWEEQACLQICLQIWSFLCDQFLQVDLQTEKWCVYCKVAFCKHTSLHQGYNLKCPSLLDEKGILFSFGFLWSVVKLVVKIFLCVHWPFAGSVYVFFPLGSPVSLLFWNEEFPLESGKQLVSGWCGVSPLHSVSLC